MDDILSLLNMINRDVEMIRKVVERMNDDMKVGTQSKKAQVRRFVSQSAFSSVQVSYCSGHSSARTEETDLEKDPSDISLPGRRTVLTSLDD